MRKAMIVVGCAAVLCAALPALGQGGDKAEAQKHFQAGLALFKAEKYDAAALELELSVKLFPTKGGLFNLANVYKVLSRYDEALAAIARLEKEYGDKMDAEMRGAVVKAKTEIESLAARLEIVVDPPGATISVDGRPAGESPLQQSVAVDPGKHVVRAELPGYAAENMIVQVVSQQTAKVRIALEREGSAAAPSVATVGDAPAVESPQHDALQQPAEAGSGTDSKKPLKPVWFWTGLGATVAFGGVALGMELAVRSNKDDLANGDELDKAEGMQKAGIAFMALAGAAAVTTAVLAAFTDFGGGEETPVAIGAAPNGVVLAGRF